MGAGEYSNRAAAFAGGAVLPGVLGGVYDRRVCDDELRAAIRDALRSLNTTTEARMREELARVPDGGDEALRFEVCPHFLGVQLTQTEEEIVPDAVALDAVPEGLRAAAEATEIDWRAILDEEFFPWLAERWEAAGGERRAREVYAFFHGPPDAPLYGFVQRRWLSARDVSGGDE